MTATVHAILKAELHVHLEGGLSPETTVRLQRKYNMPNPGAAEGYTDLPTFLIDYDRVCRAMRAPEDFRDAALDVVERCAASNVRHLEMFFSPGAHSDLSYSAMLDGLLSAFDLAAERHAMTALLIPAHNRELGPERGMDFLEMVLSDRRDRVVGIGLDYYEGPHPAAPFAAMFERARAEGLQVTNHAGESGPALNVRDAVDLLGCRRIDHGYRIMDDPALVDHCRALNVLFTVCPSTTLMMSEWQDISDPGHAIRRMIDAGLRITIASDDPGLFGIDLDGEYALLEGGGVPLATLEACARNGLSHNWLTPA